MRQAGGQRGGARRRRWGIKKGDSDAESPLIIFEGVGIMPDTF